MEEDKSAGNAAERKEIEGTGPESPDVPPLEHVSQFKRFLHHDMVGSGFLLIAAVAALIIANSGLEEWYHHLWESPFGFAFGERSLIKPLHLWVNDGLMAIFFFLVGLEIKRELIAGELASFSKAILPAAAAVGGMVLPALIFVVFNFGGEGMNGWGVPMATDIAFAAGCLAALRKWVPPGLMVFLVALAIVDDLGAVAVIAIFYTETIEVAPLIIGSSLIILSFCLGQLGVRQTWPYVVFGMIIWVAFLRSGVHATIAGVLLAFSIPPDPRYQIHLFEGRMKELLRRFVTAEMVRQVDARGEERGFQNAMVSQRQQTLIRAMNWECHHVEPPLQRIEHNLEPFAVFMILPIFAFANAGLTLDWSQFFTLLAEPVTLGILLGLTVGKPVGVLLASWLIVKSGLASLPRGVKWSQVFGVGMLAGIGFTMSLFINELAFLGAHPELVTSGKLGIFVASILSAVIGVATIRIVCKEVQTGSEAKKHALGEH